MRITTPAAQLAAQSASPCSAYKRARSIWQCVVKFCGSARSRSGGRGMPPGKRGCQKVLRHRKLFCIFCPQNGSCLSLPLYFLHFRFTLYFFVCFVFFFLFLCLLPSCLATFRFSFQLQVPRFFSFKCFNRNLSNWKIKGLQRRRQNFLLVLPKGGGEGIRNFVVFSKRLICRPFA